MPAEATSIAVTLVDVSTSEPSVITPGLFPGLRVPLTVTVPGAVPLPASHAAAATERFDPTASEPLSTSPPAFTVVVPV